MTLKLRIELYADGADVRDMVSARATGIVSGFTTNPTLMRKSGVSDYEAFAKEALHAVEGMPISFEVFADEFSEMETQAKRIATWGDAVYVKIPVTNTRGESSVPLIRRLSEAGVKLNVTAILTLGAPITASGGASVARRSEERASSGRSSWTSDRASISS